MAFTPSITTTRTRITYQQWWRRRQKLIPYFFIAPFFIVFIGFFLGPAIYAFFASFHDWHLLGEMKFIGLKNYRLLFRDRTLWLSVTNTLYYFAAALLVQYPLALLLAIALNQKALQGRHILTPLMFIPVLTSPVVVVIVFQIFLDRTYGLFNFPLRALGLEPINWLGSRQLSKAAVALLITWRWTGYNMVLFLASLQSIPQELYEAAWVDGANKARSFWHITLPMLRPAIAYVLIMGFISAWQMFDESWLLTNGGPADSSLSVGNYLYRVGIREVRMGYASAIGVVLFIMVFITSGWQNRILGLYTRGE